MSVNPDIKKIAPKQIAVARYVADLSNTGYCHILSSDFITEDDAAELSQFQASYFNLEADANGGQRFRAYKRLLYIPGEPWQEASDQWYSQSPEYNYEFGGKKRFFEAIVPEVMQSEMLRRVINADIEIAASTGDVDFTKPIRIGLHQVRYAPTCTKPSVSSPPWLHRDDEPIVFIHLLNLSHNAVGGDSIIASSKNSFDTVVKLQCPFDTICVTNKKTMHAVTPLGVEHGEIAYRDILLVTFENEFE
jgi:hypothetical protein